jgi:hypothetical protein
MTYLHVSRRAALALAACILALLLTAPSASAAIATFTNMLGPNSEPLADTTGEGQPDPANDTMLGLSRAGNTVTITSPYTCNPTSIKNQITLSNPNGNGVFQTVSRYSENLNKTQRITITGFNQAGEPNGFLFEELVGNPPTGPVVRTGMGTLLSSHNDGVYDTLELTAPGGGVLTTISLTTFDTQPGAGGLPNYISLPWGQTAALGGHTACNGSNPQVFVPIASNGHIIADLNGDGAPDPDLFASPLVAAQVSVAQVPTLTPVALSLLALLLLVAAFRLLRRVSGGAAGSGMLGA